MQTTTQSAGDALYSCLAGVIGNNGASLLIAARGFPLWGCAWRDLKSWRRR
ncbi:MAG: hypothetical protein ACLR23_27355 [Clostridia bacterium]